MYAPRGQQSPAGPDIEFLASESQLSIDDVERLYGNELTKLKAGARIHGFLHIFAFRKVREMLRRRSTAKRPPAQAAWQATETKDPGFPQGTQPATHHRALPPLRPRLSWTGDVFLL